MAMIFIAHSTQTERILALTFSLMTSSAGLAWEGIYTQDGMRLVGEIIDAKDRSESLLGPLPQVNILTVRTERCGELRFQASLEGVECLNCRENRAVQPECSISLPAKGWVLH